jgi:hypothetical protein
MLRNFLFRLKGYKNLHLSDQHIPSYSLGQEAGDVHYREMIRTLQLGKMAIRHAIEQPISVDLEDFVSYKIQITDYGYLEITLNPMRPSERHLSVFYSPSNGWAIWKEKIEWASTLTLEEMAKSVSVAFNENNDNYRPPAALEPAKGSYLPNYIVHPDADMTIFKQPLDRINPAHSHSTQSAWDAILSPNAPYSGDYKFKSSHVALAQCAREIYKKIRGDGFSNIGINLTDYVVVIAHRNSGSVITVGKIDSVWHVYDGAKIIFSATNLAEAADYVKGWLSAKDKEVNHD